jgi:hypothetical protein
VSRIDLRINKIHACLLRAACAPAAVPCAVAHGYIRRDVPELEAAPIGERTLGGVAAELPAEHAPNSASRGSKHVRTYFSWSIGCREEQLTTLIDGVANDRDVRGDIGHFPRRLPKTRGL